MLYLRSLSWTFYKKRPLCIWDLIVSNLFENSDFDLVVSDIKLIEAIDMDDCPKNKGEIARLKGLY